MFFFCITRLFVDDWNTLWFEQNIIVLKHIYRLPKVVFHSDDSEKKEEKRAMHYKNEVSYITVLTPTQLAGFQTMNYSLSFTIFDELFVNFCVCVKKKTT